MIAREMKREYHARQYLPGSTQCYRQGANTSSQKGLLHRSMGKGLEESFRAPVRGWTQEKEKTLLLDISYYQDATERRTDRSKRRFTKRGQDRIGVIGEEICFEEGAFRKRGSKKKNIKRPTGSSIPSRLNAPLMRRKKSRRHHFFVCTQLEW